MFGWSKKKKIKMEIIINWGNFETRVAILEDGKLEEFQTAYSTEERIVGCIFKGKIQNLEHDLQAAFVDIGVKRNAFLHYWDMLPDDDSRMEQAEDDSRSRVPRRRRFTNEDIESRFPPGSEIVVQVTKASIGTKGPRITASLSIPGRYLVMMPGTTLKGVSRKIESADERHRLKKALDRLPSPIGAGLIVRTAAAGAAKRSLAHDLRGLTETWKDIQRAVAEQPAPSCVYQEPDLIQRVVRDWLTEDMDRIVVDSREQFDRIKKFSSRVFRMMGRSRVHLYEGDMPIFDYYEVEAQLEKALQRKVTLKSGGCIVFDETEALIAIDVNTRRHKGKGSQEEAILEVNMEAVDEVARQLRLRNIGGLVLIDLIDMKSKKDQHAVYRAMKAALKRDRARTNVLPISELGIMEMTRQRVEEGILSSLYADCPYCGGRGQVKSPLGMSVEIQRQISAVMRKYQKSGAQRELQVLVHPTVLERLRSEDEQFLMDLESRFDGRLSFKSWPGKHIECFSISDAATGEVFYSSGEK